MNTQKNIYIKRFNGSSKISHYLRATMLQSKRYAIETRNINDSKWSVNINLPLFVTLNEAELWLSQRYHKVYYLQQSLLDMVGNPYPLLCKCKKAVPLLPEHIKLCDKEKSKE